MQRSTAAAESRIHLLSSTKHSPSTLNPLRLLALIRYIPEEEPRDSSVSPIHEVPERGKPDRRQTEKQGTRQRNTMGAPKEEEKKKPEYDEFGLLVKSPVHDAAANTTEAWVAAVAATPPPPPPPPPLEMTASDKTWNTKKMFSEDPADPTSTVGTGGPVSEWSHQQIVRRADTDIRPAVPEEPDEWQDMPAFASQDLYDDDGRLIARAAVESESEDGKGGASKGYTRVYDDEDAQSATSMDENTSYLFKETEDDEASRSPLSQMQATKDLLTEGQRIAYVGVCKLAMVEMAAEVGRGGSAGKAVKKELGWAKESMKMWSQKMMVRLYMHMDISPAGECAVFANPGDGGRGC